MAGRVQSEAHERRVRGVLRDLVTTAMSSPVRPTRYDVEAVGVPEEHVGEILAELLALRARRAEGDGSTQSAPAELSRQWAASWAEQIDPPDNSAAVRQLLAQIEPIG